MFTRLLHAWKAFFSRGCLTTFASRLACVLGAYKLGNNTLYYLPPLVSKLSLIYSWYFSTRNAKYRDTSPFLLFSLFLCASLQPAAFSHRSYAENCVSYLFFQGFHDWQLNQGYSS
jgi:hypothetical protein